ncbi:type II toxin-antitoxin system RelE/ParE family toxin [Hymenobacter lapidiphilus]|uniref:Type II toxin-antitoxin system RelE/ParE family toxin n=1 Tax=Hymenobacter lapidiphilus TaxID=2608003 RepID=A0A7Y7PKT7_9BACT|nr:type II toxin-antitoxin system RelE/ParE family toxin [Hymenobacter lapidiphilus]NVO29694.1 type II toxin-antitoxin system RelE/ParE family toxin [Hymenobacter lapidiphilus]
MKEKFQVQLSGEVREFIGGLDAKAREKVLYNIRKAQLVNDQELFKKLTDSIWEFRTLFNKTHYRIFAFWDKTGPMDTLVLTTHGLIKKTGKTPQADLDKAERIRRIYFEQKTN